MPLLDDAPPAPVTVPGPRDLFPGDFNALARRLASEAVAWLRGRPGSLALAGTWATIAVPLASLPSWPHALGAPTADFFALMLAVQGEMRDAGWLASWGGPTLWPEPPPGARLAVRVEGGYLEAADYLCLPREMRREMLPREDLRDTVESTAKSEQIVANPAGWLLRVTPA